MRITFFKFDWIIDVLNQLWYSHFITKSQYNDSDFKKWTWFYLDSDNKEYWKWVVYNSVSKEYIINFLKWKS